MNKLNHTCIICGTKYHSCDTCNEVKKITPYKVLCDTENHYMIHMIITDYVAGNITKKVAATRLGKCDLTGMKDFQIGAKNVLDEILAKEEIKNAETKTK